MSLVRTRWAAIGAAVAVTLGGGGIAMVSATSPSDAVAFVPITPCRVMDTRPSEQVGPRSTPLGANDTHTVDAIDGGADAGDCAGEIPADATAISMNVTTVDATAATFLTIWEADVSPRPIASSLNPAPGQPPTPNAVTTNLNANGEFSIFNLAGSVHVLADIDGYYTDHHHDDRYYTEAEIDSQLAELTGMNIVDGSLTLADLGGGGERSLTVSNPVDIPGGTCRSLGGGNSGEQHIGKLVLFTIADADGDAVIPNGATAVPSVVIGTSQGGAIIQFLVCNGRTSQFTVPAGAVVSGRMIAP